eukprot:TRINITY_DN80494_c0_g1_i1.p1 TRINITY_DN80494_c0_g1~~TRINITY_DN80494_c0_g1_i1.p1  ORF type:complete len:377 (+),score=6.73 TRINITY_DN80494_c0_g1_i1:66-1196(+)
MAAATSAPVLKSLNCRQPSVAARGNGLRPRGTVGPSHATPFFSGNRSALMRNATSASAPAKRVAVVSPQSVLVKGKSYGVSAAQGTARPVMEDRHAVSVDGDGSARPSYFAVFDGHGGAAVAEFLVKELWGTYQRRLAGAVSSGLDVERATVKAFEEVDKMTLAPPKGFFGMMMERGMGGPKCGACANTAVLLPGGDGATWQLITANVGDSRTVLSRGGQPLQLSVDHKPNVEAERTRIERKNPTPGQPLVRMAGGEWRVGGLLALSRAFGDVYLKDWSDGTRDGARGGFGLTAEPSVFTLALQPGDDWLLLGTDGFWDSVPSQEAIDLCRNQGSDAKPDALAAELVALAQKRGSTDDVTVIVVRLPTADVAPASE